MSPTTCSAGLVTLAIPTFANMTRTLLMLTGLQWASLGTLHASEPVKLPPQEQFHLFLLSGQSNMAGRGAVEEQDKKPHPRVLTLDKAGTWTPAIDPLHFDKSAAGTGLGKTFGIQVAEANPGITVGLIPCAVGGSPRSSIRPPRWPDRRVG